MNKFFYPKLAVINIKKNAKTYIPYVLTCIFTVAMFYIIRSLALNEGINKLIGADTITSTMQLGSIIVALFAVIFLFYTNSFLMKRRKKEFGLFNILGMEKKHLSKIIAFETLYIAVISLCMGLLIGIILDKLMYLLILNLLSVEVSLGFYISRGAITNTILLFSFIFFLIFLNSFRQIHLTNPIELLRGGNTGEKEPKTKWIMTILGCICLGLGYYISLTTKNPIAAITFFFVAVILVIIGTYLIFTAGSIALLKILKKNKHYYYQTRHFISVSGMIYRMKQNAVGLSNICILSTMVLVMVSSTLSMMIGLEDIINTSYPYDITIYSNEQSAKKNNEIMHITQDIAKENNLKIKNKISYTYLFFSGFRDGDSFILDRDEVQLDLDKLCNIFAVTLEDYNRATGENKTLNKNQIMVYSNRDSLPSNTLNLLNTKYDIVETLDDFIGNSNMAAQVASSHFIVVNDMQQIKNMYKEQKKIYGKNASDIRFCYGFDVTGNEKQKIKLYKKVLNELLEKEYNVSIDSKADSRSTLVSIYGSLFFLGIFLGSLFIMATILIIYYKQISEGYDDKERFIIMQNVGMSHAEVKKSIHSQILTVFFLPLVIAGIHVAFAFPFIKRILEILNLMNTKLYILCTVGCFIVFAIFYGIIYSLTAKNYYRIVSK